MDKNRPSFADDLAAIQEDVTADVGKILQLAKSPSSATVVQEQAPPLQPVAKESVRRVKKTVTPKAERETRDSQPLENVTTRLTRETNELLTEVALRQRLKKRTPDTRQAIMEHALREFFQQNGYLSKNDTDVANGQD